MMKRLESVCAFLYSLCSYLFYGIYALVIASVHAGWAPFKWESFDCCGTIHPHSMIFLPATLDGMKCHVQLNTGMYSAFSSDLDYPISGETEKVILKLGPINKQVTFDKKSLKYIHQSSECGVVGMVGNGLFDQGTLSLDTAQGLFKFDQTSLLKDDKKSNHLIYKNRSGWDQGYIGMQVTLPGQSSYYALFNTRFAMFTFLPFDRRLWEQLKDPKKKQQSDKSFFTEGSVNVVSGDLCHAEDGIQIKIGNIQLKEGLLGYCQAPKLKNIPTEAIGELGMKGFSNGILTIDYVSKKWRFIPKN